jgi:hypothetical protein
VVPSDQGWVPAPSRASRASSGQYASPSQPASAAAPPAPDTRPCAAARWCPAPPWRASAPHPHRARLRPWRLERRCGASLIVYFIQSARRWMLCSPHGLQALISKCRRNRPHGHVHNCRRHPAGRRPEGQALPSHPLSWIRSCPAPAGAALRRPSPCRPLRRHYRRGLNYPR